MVEALASTVLSRITELKENTLSVKDLKSAQIQADIYLLCSFKYYREYESLLPDEMFDEICKNLIEQSDEFLKHNGIEREQLVAGTGYAINFSNLPDFSKTLLSMCLLILDKQKV